MTTGIVFGLLVVAHVWRIFAESRALASDPGYLAITLSCAALGLWAGALLRRPTSR
jgi:hypothetical protein